MAHRVRTHLPAPLGALALGTLAVALWSGSTVVEKVLLGRMPPVTLLAWQLAVSVAGLWGALLLGRRTLPKGAWLRLGWPGLVQPGLANLLLLLGLSLTSANTFSLLNSCETVIGLLFARALLGERVGSRVAVLAGLATLGVMLVTLGAPHEEGANTWVGVGLVLGGTMFAALYGVVSRPAASTSGTDPLLLTALHQTLGLAVVLVAWGVALGRGEGAALRGIDASTWAWAALAGLFQYAVPFWLFLLALRRLSASAVSLLFTLGPVFVIVLAFLVLGEWLSPLQWWGAALTLASLTLIAAWPGRAASGASS